MSQPLNPQIQANKNDNNDRDMDMDNPNSTSASLRPPYQKALDRLGRACWYLRPNVPAPINDSQDMYHALTAFGYGVFGPTDLDRKIDIQRGTETSVWGSEKAKGKQDRWVEVCRLLSGAVDALEEAKMEEEAEGLVKVAKWFEVRWVDYEGWGGSSAASSEEEDVDEDDGMGEEGGEGGGEV